MSGKKTFIILDEQRLLNAVEHLRSLPVDGTYEAVFRPFKKSRSDKQNAALWAVAYPPFMLHMGLRGEKDRLDLHEFFCGEYWGWVKHSILGRDKNRPVRTTTRDENGKRDLVDKTIMADFYSFIQQKGAENDVYVPDPNPMYGIK